MAIDTILYSAERQAIKESYDRIALAYQQWSTESHDYRIDYLNKLLDSSPALCSEAGTALELGCGNGMPAISMLLARNPKLRVIGNDLSTSQLELARTNLAEYESRLDLVEGDMTKLNFPEESLSAIIGLYTIIHLRPSEQLEMIAKFWSWLKKGGRLMMNFEHEPVEAEVWGDWLDKKRRLLQYGVGTTKMLSALRAHGFQIELDVLQGSEETGGKAYTWVIASKPM